MVDSRVFEFVDGTGKKTTGSAVRLARCQNRRNGATHDGIGVFVGDSSCRDTSRV